MAVDGLAGRIENAAQAHAALKELLQSMGITKALGIFETEGENQILFEMGCKPSEKAGLMYVMKKSVDFHLLTLLRGDLTSAETTHTEEAVPTHNPGPGDGK